MVAVVVLRPPAGVVMVHAEADEGISLGRDEPPASAVMLGAEEPGCFELLPVQPPKRSSSTVEVAPEAMFALKSPVPPVVVTR